MELHISNNPVRENVFLLDEVVQRKKKVNEININIVKITKTTELLIERYWDENTAGIMIKKINGFFMPPVKKNKTPNCKISYIK